ncbi:MAG: accessory gene regulator B family protein [Lachnospiraceae bacterium]|nr:accessory gene regulator B family protein [Lachnospiraceae bacterium]
MKFIRYFAQKLCKKMVMKGIVKEEDAELYIYGIVNGLIMSGNIMTAFLIGILTRRLEIVLVFLFFYASLRTFSGGYHMESKLLCYVFSSLILLIPVYTKDWVLSHIPMAALVIIGVLAVVIIMVLSPVESIHKRLEPEERKFFRRVSHCIVSIQFCIVVGLLFLDMYDFCYTGYVSILLVALFMGIGWTTTKRYT